MDMNELVRFITEEVLKQLNNRPQPEILVLVTGGRSVWPKVRFNLKEIGSRGVLLTAVLSRAAEDVFDAGELQQIFTSVNQVPRKDMLSVIKRSTLVLLPTLTVNTAGKLANCIQDTTVTSIAGWSLLMGKPVVAVSNAADPDAPELRSLGVCDSNAQYRIRLKDHLKCLKSFGIELTDAESLLPVVMRMIDGCRIGGNKNIRAEGVITKAMVMEAAARDASLIVGGKAVITPLARIRLRRRESGLFRNNGGWMVMYIGRVIGTVVSTTKDTRLTGSKLLLVMPMGLQANPAGTPIVAVDSVDAGMGEMVLYVTGSVARRALTADDAPIDCAIVGVIDDMEISELLLDPAKLRLLGAER